MQMSIFIYLSMAGKYSFHDKSMQAQELDTFK